MSDPSLRAARPGDLQAVLDLLAREDLPGAGVPEALDRFVVAEADGRVVGVAGVEAFGVEGVLRSVAVDRSLRSRGVGRRLVDAAVAGARNGGLERLFLLTTTAQGWFPRWGFRVVDRAAASDAVRASVEFAEACPASAVAMVLELMPEESAS